jgi:hypothetical protein
MNVNVKNVIAKNATMNANVKNVKKITKKKNALAAIMKRNNISLY